MPGLVARTGAVYGLPPLHRPLWTVLGALAGAVLVASALGWWRAVRL